MTRENRKKNKHTKIVVAGAIGECAHVAGVYNFLHIAEQNGWKTIFLGPAVPIEKIILSATENQADMVAVSYRLTPQTGERLLADFSEAADDLRSKGIRFAFGGTPPVAEKANNIGFFHAVFDGSQPVEEIVSFLREEEQASISQIKYPQTMVDRRTWKSPFPLLRHHFGLPTMESTIKGIEKISDAKVLDVISLGIDQDAQANFFHPERQNPRSTGAGGVPVRNAEGYKKLYKASRRGNQPLMRSYSGTDDFIQLAEMYLKTINICWAAVPIFWFNKMDGRGPWDLEGSIREHNQVISWYAEHDIPVELNEPHHWGMRDASDVIFVVSAYLSAYIAKEMGVKDYIAQMMFNSPAGLSDQMDLAKMQACLEITKPLEDKDFHIWKQTRTGLLSYPLEENAARAHLAASIYLQMALKPDIVHIVGHTEAHHAATAEDVINASLMARRAIENALKGQPDFKNDETISQRVDHLVQQAKITLKAIGNIQESDADPFIDPKNLAKAIGKGILDAPHLKNNSFARGTIQTRIINGGCEVVDEKGNILPEEKRLSKFL